MKALGKLKKLRGRSAEELRVRAGQALASLAERRGWSRASRLPTDAELFGMLRASGVAETKGAEELLAHFRERKSPSFFASFADAAATRAELGRRFGGDDTARVVERADAISEGRFDLLGLRGLKFGEPVDWHLEPLAQKRAPLAHWSGIDYLNREVAGDKKIVWELSRQQFLQTLGRAYWRTGDERHARTFAALLNSWMDANPPKLGINWASSLEVAFRSIAWLWALYFFKDSAALSPSLFARAVKFLYVHARHLETYLSTYFSPNTHLTGEALGLFYIGTLLPELGADAARWRETGRRILSAQLDRHVRPDGVYFEQSTYYQRYTADFYTHLFVLARANGVELESKVGEKLRLLLDHLMHVTRPDGTTPFFGDDDGGRLVTLDERAADDFRAALSNGAALFGRADYKHVAGELAEETLWLLGAEGAHAFDRIEARPPAASSRAFADGGYYVMRDGWTPESNYMMLDCGPHGADNCGHAHADALSFDLAARGRTLLVDPGTYTYTGDRGARDLFRSSPAHNTLAVGGESSSVPGAGPFLWRHVARTRERAWLTRDRFDFFEGEHDGYTRLDPALVHTRAVLFVKGGYWVVRDRVGGTASEQLCELRFHFAPGATPELTREETTTGSIPFISESPPTADAPALDIYCFGTSGGEWRGEEGQVSRCYAARERARVAVYAEAASGAREFVTFLMPRAAGEQRAVVCEMEKGRGRAFVVTSRDSRDWVVLRGEAGLVSAGPITSDFEWSWVRFARDGGVPDELILVNGGRFFLGGQRVVKESRPMPYLYARREGERLLVETERWECVVALQPAPALFDEGVLAWTRQFLNSDS